MSPAQTPPPDQRNPVGGRLGDLRESWLDITQGGFRGSPWLPDLALTGGLLLFVVLFSVGSGVPLFFAGITMIVPLYWRRTHPLPAALVIAAACLAQLVLIDGPHTANIAVPIIVYSAAAFGDRTASRAVLGLGLLGALLAGFGWTYGTEFGTLASAVVSTVFMAMFVGVAWLGGDVVRRRKAVVARLQAQNRALARDQSQRARLAAQDERASIAREMHDVVAHSLAVVVVQADGGLYAARQALQRDPGMARDRAALEQAAATLETLAETARTSLADTRRLVGVLRESGSGAEYSPLQGLDHLDELVGRVQDSGVRVETTVRGDLTGLSREADLAAYRVIQESLTNALKHAGPDVQVEVDLLRSPTVLLVRVTDDGRGGAGASDGEGNGLIGMRERVEVLGGSVHAGPRRTGGWEVVATIPVASAGADGAIEPNDAAGADHPPPTNGIPATTRETSSD